jgi:hypothetical protein
MGIASRRCGPRERSEEKWPPMKDWLGGPAHRRPLIVHSFIHTRSGSVVMLAVSCIISLLLSDCCLRPAGRSPKDKEAAGCGVCPGPHRSSQSCAGHASEPCRDRTFMWFQQRHRAQAQQDFRCTGARGRGHLPVSVSSRRHRAGVSRVGEADNAGARA